ncbi:MAG: SDR family oxidoreductase [Phycisphaerales bacterium]|nr:MAG: SDR family oxidoreductase [Phycisphaerales bacterium]
MAITGSSTGIGKVCALHLDAIGFTVFAGVRNQGDGDALRSEASERLTPILVDVTKADSIASAARTVASAVGDDGLHGLLNNAGIVVSGPLECLPIDELRRQLEVNVVGQVAVTQAFAPLLRKGSGRIVNMGSDCGQIAAPFLGAYCASKYALEALTDALRMELRPHGIYVCIIEPGSIDTPLWNKSLAEGDRLMKTLPDEAHDLYGPAMTRTRKAATKMAQASIAATAVAKAVARALTARRPKPRYIVGHDARLRIALARFLPSRILDRLVMRSLGLR